MFYAHFQSIFELNGEYLALSTNSELKTQDFRTWYGAYFGNEYFDFINTPILGLFAKPYASGIVGYFLVALFNNLFNVLTVHSLSPIPIFYYSILILAL